MDVVVNHLLVDQFGFDRQQVDPKNQLCWLDTVFGKKYVAPDETFEYYFNLLASQCQKSTGNGPGKGGLGNGQVLDDHSGLAGAL